MKNYLRSISGVTLRDAPKLCHGVLPYLNEAPSLTVWQVQSRRTGSFCGAGTNWFYGSSNRRTSSPVNVSRSSSACSILSTLALTPIEKPASGQRKRPDTTPALSHNTDKIPDTGF
jgi:hypothetical protein